MALAILKYLDRDSESVHFRVDIGTSSYYKLRIGKRIIERSGLNWVQDELFSTELRRKRSEYGFFDTGEDVALPLSCFSESCYVQLFSCKDISGRSPAVSKVLKFNAINPQHMQDLELAAPFSVQQRSFNKVRAVACSHEQYAMQSSWEAIVSTILRAAVPVAVNMLTSANGTAAAPAGAAAPGQQGALTNLLQTVISAIAGGSGTAGAPVRQQSVSGRFSREMVAGIDDALIIALAPVIASVVGPMIQQGISALPQMIGAVGQIQQHDQNHRRQTLQAQNQLIATLAGDVNRRLMLQRLLDSQQPGGSLTPEQINQLTQLLQQSGGASSAPPVAAQNLSVGRDLSAALSNTVIVSYETAPALPWNNSTKLLYRKGVPAVFSIVLNVNPAPKAPLPKAIIKVCFKDLQDGKMVFEKIFRQKDVAANTAIDLAFTKEELAAIPPQRPMSLITEVRWIASKSGRTCKALGSTEVVFVNDYSFKSRGLPVGEEKELADMNVYRVFWNKVWESPVLHRAGSGKSMWELDITGKYLYAFDITEGSNALMETRILRQPDDPDSLTDLTTGKLKGGMELSVDELNKLTTLWPGGQPLVSGQLEALKTAQFAAANAMHMVFTTRMKGRARERGIVWIVPTFKAFELILQQAGNTDSKGQITLVTEQKVLFPLPVNARVIGLKSNNQ